MATAGKPQTIVAQLYQTVIEDVINNVRDSFLDDGVDDQVLQELKQIWESKLSQTKAVDTPTIGERHRPALYAYMPQAKTGQPVVYQAIPAQTVQLSAASQQAQMAIPDVVYRQGGNIVLPTQNQPIFTSYQPVRLLQQQAPAQQVRQAGGSGHTIVLASTSRGVASQQQSQNNSKPGSSNVIQVDGSSENIATASETTVPSGSDTAFPRKITKRKNKCKPKIIFQVDGRGDSSSSDDDIEGEDDDDDDDGDDDEEEDEEAQEQESVDEDPLNSGDDDSDQDANELFDTDNVVVCQYDKIHRAKAKWKFNLKVGIMNLEGKDHVFQKANGEADW